MNPTLAAGDVVTVCTGTYLPGDILVFFYKEGFLLIHRLLYIKNGRYFCKGDNALRVEDLTEDKIVGKAVAVNGFPLSPWPKWKIELSRKVGKELHRCSYDPNRTKQSKIYQIYQLLVLKRKEEPIMYQKNKDLTYILTDETSLAIFNPESGETHLLDDIGIAILDRLNEPIALDTLLESLCKEFDAEPTQIHDDVEAFLAEMIQKKVVLLG